MKDHDDLINADYPEAPVRLSEAGLRRREEMLALLQRACVRRKKQRVVARWGSGLLAVLVLGMLVFSTQRPPHPESDEPMTEVIEVEKPSPLERTPVVVRVDVIRNEPGILERYAVKGKARIRPEVFIKSDEELMEFLAAANRPAGLIRVEGELILSDAVR